MTGTIKKRGVTILALRMAAAVSAVLLALAAALSVTGCANEQNDVAATVDGHEIMESKVTDYIQQIRSANGAVSDEDWAQWLVDNDLTPESLREDIINSFAEDYLIEQAAEQLGVSVTDEDVEAEWAKVAEPYQSNPEELAEELSLMGYDENSYKDYIRSSLLQSKVADALNLDSGSDEEVEKSVMEELSTYTELLDGSRKIETIVCGDEQTAKDVKARLDAGESFEKVKSEVSDAGDYDGWTAFIGVDENVNDAISNVGKGKVSDIIKGDDEDKFFIVKVQDVLNLGKDGFKDKSEVPQDIYELIEEVVVDDNKNTAFSEHIQGLVEQAEIVINPMPEGLPYDVSLEGVEPSSDEEAMADDGIVVEGDEEADGEEGTEVYNDVAVEQIAVDGEDDGTEGETTSSDEAPAEDSQSDDDLVVNVEK